MKNFSLPFLAFLTALSTSGLADDCTSDEECCNRLDLEVKAGYFFFSDSKMRKIYDKGGFDVQLSGSYPLWRCLQLYGSVEYLQCHGRSLADHQKTRIREVPFSLGLRALFPLGCNFSYYLTAGPRFFCVHSHNDSSYVDRTISKSGLGLFVNTGFTYSLSQCFFVDLFGEYSYGRLNYTSYKTNTYGEKTQVGGFTFGAGLGYSF